MADSVGFEQLNRNINMSKPKNKNPRTCFTCRASFVPTSTGKNCPKCARIKSLVLCPACNINKISINNKTCRSCRPQDGSNNGAWKGGKSKHCKGYITIRINGKNVLEHRYIMEQMIGRPLKSNEQVHHKNCLKWDNRPGNLELWVKSQPSGARAKDLVAWAKSLLNDYEAMYPEE